MLLLNDEDLAYAKVRLDPVSLATATEHLRDMPDAMARSVVWGAAWDMLRDAETGAGRFVDLVLRQRRRRDRVLGRAHRWCAS